MPGENKSLSYRRSRDGIIRSKTSRKQGKQGKHGMCPMKEAIPQDFFEKVGISSSEGSDVYRELQEKVSVEAVSKTLECWGENLSCMDARKFYKEFQERMYDVWESFARRHGMKRKHRCLCRSYIRWLARVLARKKTDASQSMCEPRALENRDRIKYSCHADDNNNVCPSLQYLYKKYSLSDEWDDDDDRWEVLCGSAARTNYVVDMATKAWNVVVNGWRPLSRRKSTTKS